MNRQNKWYKEYLVRLFDRSIGHLDKDHKSALNILARQVFTHRLLVSSTLLLGLLSAIFEGGSIGILGLAASVVAGEGTFALPIEIWKVNQFINNWLETKERSTLFLLLIGVALVLQLSRSLLTFLSGLCSIQIHYTVTRELWERAIRHLMSFSLGEIQRHPIGYANSIVGTTARITSLIGWGSNVLLIFYYLLVYVFLLFISSSLLALLAIGITILVSFSVTRVVKNISKLSKLGVEAMLNTGRITMEFLQAPRLVRIFDATDYASDSINSARLEELNAERKSSLIQVAVRPITESALMVGACLFLTGAYLLAGNSAEKLVGGVTVFILILLRAMPRINQLNNARFQLARILPSLRVAGGFLRTDDKSFLRSGGQTFSGFDREIVLDQVSYQFPDRDDNVLEEISLKIQKGSTVAVVGPSGGGKSTLMNLLLGVYTATAGQILIDGVPLESIRLKDWLHHIGYVDQAVYLFDSTIAENISFGNPMATTEMIISAAKRANADEFIRQLPQGYDTNIGERGYRLSGGQQQRIALARALVRNPQILMLDEATSSLDSESEYLIQQTLRELQTTCTIFMIAHRLSTVKYADTIIVLDSGRVLETGTADQLMANKSYFQRVSSIQRESDTTP